MKRIVSLELQKTIARIVHVKTATNQNRMVQAEFSSGSAYVKENALVLAEAERRRAEAQATYRRSFL